MIFLNLTAVITGASSGMGLLLSKIIVGLGGNVVMADINKKVVERQSEEINKTSEEWTFGIVCDVRDYSQVENV